MDSVPLAVSKRILYEPCKRALDLTVSSALVVLFSPVLAVAALAIKLDSRGPIFFRQTRIGRGGRRFHIYKLRTMVQDAQSKGPSVTSSDDPRITRLGKVLRGTKIDELPQFLNVLRGDMSLVGPRPQVPKYVERFPEGQRQVILSVRPGITGPTAIKFRHEEDILQAREDREDFYMKVLLPIKCDLDEEYVRSRSFRSDFTFLAQTGRILGRGIVNRIRRRPMGRDIEHPLPNLDLPSFITLRSHPVRDSAREEPAQVR